MIAGESFTDVYVQLAKLIRDEHEYQSSPRGQLVKESLGVRFEITDARNRLLYIPARNMSIGYTIAEALWYFLGDNKTDWISYYSDFWRNISDDGETANSAYGARIFKEHPRVKTAYEHGKTQWRCCIDELTKDNDSRRSFIHIRSPLDNQAKLDAPCTIGLQFFIRDGALHLLVNMRSSDLILGITYDIPAFTLMQEAMLLELKDRGLDIRLGRYIHVSNSLHVYERHFDMLNKIADTTVDFDCPAMPVMPWLFAVNNPLNDLNACQASYRAGYHLKRVERSCELFDGHKPYYGDWNRILAIHAMRMHLKDAKKRDADEAESLRALIRQTRSNLNFEGFKRFKK